MPKKGKYDWGWVEDTKGDKVWSPWETATTSASYAGGNRFNRITVEKIKLQPGDYKLRYSSDAIYSAALWTMAPPDHPEHCSAVGRTAGTTCRPSSSSSRNPGAWKGGRPRRRSESLP